MRIIGSKRSIRSDAGTRLKRPSETAIGNLALGKIQTSIEEARAFRDCNHSGAVFLLRPIYR